MRNNIENPKPETIESLKPQTQDELNKYFTSLDDDVYFFTDELTPGQAATAMAMVSRRQGDIRYIVGKYFIEGTQSPAQRAERILGYGDDSVAQLVYVPFGVERISNLATKKIEYKREGNYIEQSSRYVAYDIRDADGRFPFYTPPELDSDVAVTYESAMQEIFELYSTALGLTQKYLHSILEKPDELGNVDWESTVRAQACDAVRLMLPASTSSNVGIEMSAQAIEGLILQLKSDRLEEMRNLGDKILQHARLVIPEFLTRVDLPKRGGEWREYLVETQDRMSGIVKSLGLRSVNSIGPIQSSIVELVDYMPKDELSIVSGVLFAESNSSFREIEDITASMSYEQKESILRAYMGERGNRRHKPGRAFEIPHYSWQIVQDYGSFRDLQRHRKIDAPEWQELSPMHGRVETPELVIKSGAKKQFEKAFEISNNLYSLLESTYGTQVAQYAALFGHNIRWTFTENAREAFHLHELRTAPAGHPAYRKVTQEMHRQLSQVHPIIASGMEYVDMGDSPQVTRLQEALRKAAKDRKEGFK